MTENQDGPWRHGTPADGSRAGGQGQSLDGELHPNHGRHTVASDDDPAEVDAELPRFRPRSTAVDAGPVIESDPLAPSYRVRDYSPEGRRAGPVWAPSYVRAEADPDLPSESFSRTGPLFARRSFVTPEEDSLSALPDRRAREAYAGGHRRPGADRSRVNPDTESHEEVVASKEARFEASNAETAAVPTVAEVEQYRELAPEPTGFAPVEPPRAPAPPATPAPAEEPPSSVSAAPSSAPAWGIELPSWAEPFEVAAAASTPAEPAAGAASGAAPTSTPLGAGAGLDADGLPTWNEAEGRPMRRRELRALREAMEAAAGSRSPAEAQQHDQAEPGLSHQAPAIAVPESAAPSAPPVEPVFPAQAQQAPASFDPAPEWPAAAREAPPEPAGAAPHSVEPRAAEFQAAEPHAAEPNISDHRGAAPARAPWPSWAIADSEPEQRADRASAYSSPPPTIGPSGDVEYPQLPAEVEYTVGGTRWEIPRAPVRADAWPVAVELPAADAAQAEVVDASPADRAASEPGARSVFAPHSSGEFAPAAPPVEGVSAPFALQEPPEARSTRSSADVAAAVATRADPWALDDLVRQVSASEQPVQPGRTGWASQPAEPSAVPLVDGSVDLVPVEPLPEEPNPFAPPESRPHRTPDPEALPRSTAPVAEPPSLNAARIRATESAPSWAPPMGLPLQPTATAANFGHAPAGAPGYVDDAPSVPSWLPPAAAAIVALDPSADAQPLDQPGPEAPGVAASREVHGGSSAVTTSALVLDQAPSLELTGPINTMTGEILVTGSVLLPSSLAETGAHPLMLDEAALDHELDPGDYQLVSTQSQPIRAVQALSTGMSQSIVSPARRGGNRGLTALIAISGVLVLLVGGLLVYGLVTNAFHL